MDAAAAAAAVVGKRGNELDYESLRDARISENKARLEMLGLRRAKEELNAMAAAAAPARRPWTHKQYATGPPRRSPRLNGLAVKHKALPLRGLLGKVTAVAVEEKEEEEGEHSAPVVVDEEMVPAAQDSDVEGTDAVPLPVHDPVQGEAAISACIHMPLLIAPATQEIVKSG